MKNNPPEFKFSARMDMPSEESEARMPVRRNELLRLDRMAKKIPERSESFSPRTTWWLGIGVATLVSFVTLIASTEDPDPMGKAVLVAITILGFGVGADSYRQDKKSLQRQQNPVDDLCEEIKEMMEHHPEETPPATPAQGIPQVASKGEASAQ